MNPKKFEKALVTKQLAKVQAAGRKPFNIGELESVQVMNWIADNGWPQVLPTVAVGTPNSQTMTLEILKNAYQAVTNDMIIFDTGGVQIMLRGDIVEYKAVQPEMVVKIATS